MSSRLLDPDQSGDARPIVWRNLDQAAAATFRAHEPPARAGEDSAGALQGLAAQQQRIHELERELDQRARDAHQQGYAAGQAAGAQQASQELDPVLGRMALSLHELAGLRGKIRAELEEDSVRLAIAVARKILYREITVDADALLGLVKAAFQRVDAREMHRIRVHPEDVPSLELHLRSSGMPARLELVADPSLERGALLLETTRGNLDASIGTQLLEIERGFLDVVKRSRNAV